MFQKVITAEPQLRERGFIGDFHFLPHHDCHAASAFLVSPFDESAVLVIDGIGEYESTTLYHGRGTKLERIEHYDFPNSLGFLWETMCKYIGFAKTDACKLMGLASYGAPSTYREAFSRLLPSLRTLEVDDRVIQLRSENYAAMEEIFDIPRRSQPISSVDSASSVRIETTSFTARTSAPTMTKTRSSRPSNRRT